MGSPTSSDKIPRREMMKVVGGGLATAGIASLAGCSESAGGSSSAFIFSNNQDLAATTANHYSATRSENKKIPALMYESYLNNNSRSGETTYNLIEEFSVDGSTLTFSIQDDRTWHNGDPVTAEDVVTHFRLAVATGNDPNLGITDAQFSGISQVDEHTVEVELNGEYNEQLIRTRIFGAGSNTARGACLWTKTSEFGEYADTWANASSESERESVVTELTELTIDHQDIIGNGLYQIDETSGTEFTFSLYEDHPEAGDVDIDEIRMPVIMPSAFIPAARSGEHDTVRHFSPTADVAESPPSGWNTETVPGGSRGGPALIPNHQHEIYGMREVKQAFAHIIQSPEVVATIGEHIATPVPPTNTFSQTFMDEYMGDPIEGNVNVYDSTDEAASLLESAGFTQDGGTWYQPNGNQFSPTISTWSTGPYAPAARTVAGNLSSFGIETDVLVEENSTFFTNYPEGSYDLAMEHWGAGTSHPYFGMTRNFTGFGGGSMQFPEEVSVPPVGDMEGEEETVNVDEMLNSVLLASDNEEMIQSMREVAWVANVTLPVIPAVETQALLLYNESDWNWPENGSDTWGYQNVRVPWFIETGELSSSN
ncbi:ABC transporter substrate-binding protein [Salinarchaeum laminariae]|uniref:ABC transporter substrate-binding protein n=1 Tax=Salinarchaeum laminariae TaxID=869888 RepID=UPI0020BE25D5|nr:ABC transporter substrate-binding protein [Salinarchaeum laminariae]